MKITEIGEEEKRISGGVVNSIVTVDAKRVLVGAGARILFYPTLLYNVFRNKLQAEFRWWDEIDQVVFFFKEIDMFVILLLLSIHNMNEYIYHGSFCR